MGRRQGQEAGAGGRDRSQEQEAGARGKGQKPGAFFVYLQDWDVWDTHLYAEIQPKRCSDTNLAVLTDPV